VNQQLVPKEDGNLLETVIQATHGSSDHPLKIGEYEIPCYVLEDGRRVLVLSSMINALDLSQGTASARASGNRLSKFLQSKSLTGYVPDELAKAVNSPIRFCTPNGSLANGYEATILATICESVLEAREKGKLNYQQERIAKRCEILVRGFARVGIIALVDEATGYQDYRSRQALEEILEKFISEDLAKWAKTFPDDFYRELFRLRGWQYSPLSVKRPQVIGHLTNDIVYARLAPGVLAKLKEVTPKDDRGRRKHKFFQRLTEEVGDPRLREHLYAVTALMRASQNWIVFHRLLERSLPKFNQTLPLPFEEEIEEKPRRLLRKNEEIG
jgi:P63C domain